MDGDKGIRGGRASAAPEAQTYRPGYEIAAERILEYIQREGLEPGDRMPTEKNLAASLQVSHTVAREAIKLLSARGMVITRKRAGIFVAEPSPQVAGETWGPLLVENLEHVQMLYETRQTIETDTAQLAAKRATPQEVRAIREAAEETVEAAERGDFPAYITADEKLHLAVAKASQNIIFASLVDTLTRLKRKVMTVGFEHDHDAAATFRRGAREHVAIAEAIGQGEPEAAAAAMREHIDKALEQYRRQIQRRLFSTTHQETSG